MNNPEKLPQWLQTLHRFLALKSEIFLYGNVYDSYLYPINFQNANDTSELNYITVDKLKDLLMLYLFSQGYELFSYFDVVDGLEIRSAENNPETIDQNNIIEKLNLPSVASNYQKKAQVGNREDAISFFREIIKNTQYLSVSVINFTSRFTSNPNALSEEEIPVFLKILKSAQESVSFPKKNGKRNLQIFICDKLNDIPAWLLLENPLTKGIEIPKPSREERKIFIDKRIHRFYNEGIEIKKSEIIKSFPDLTENFSMRELENLISISQQDSVHINQIKEIIDIYKYGLRENPWEKIEPDTIRNAANILEQRVKGQQPAIIKSVSIIQRSNLGMDAIDRSRPSNKPKGVLFFAGPTGTGKTELAKSLAELIFSDEDAIIRFDMSEYNDSNSDVKLIGSPPGYVGYEEGGQLTDAIRKKPFSIVLFDEIEKAHPKIFDKFLQILDDGRLTDGKGETVYFSQAFIIFTSNLGMYKLDSNGHRKKNISYQKEGKQGDSYEQIQEKIMEEIRNFFTTQLGRPEILNRFGNNFVVFDFIREDVATKIIEKNIRLIQSNLDNLFQIKLNTSENFYHLFLEHIVKENLVMGGRGIVNNIETHIKNGLTTFMFEHQKTSNCTILMSVEDKKVIFS